MPPRSSPAAPGAAMPDRGPIVCACFDVGVTAIVEAIASARATSVAEIGALLARRHQLRLVPPRARRAARP